jgi:hypothetical protein
MSKRAKWSIGIIALIAVVAVVGLSAAKRGNKGIEVRIEEVQARDLVASVTASGQVQPRTKVDVSADVTGRIVSSRREGRSDGDARAVPAADRPGAGRGRGAAVEAALSAARGTGSAVARQFPAGRAQLRAHGGDPEGQSAARVGWSSWSSCARRSK